MVRDQIVLITSAAGGIGRAAAIAAVRECACLALADWNLKGAQQSASEVTQAGRAVLPLRADIGSADDVDAMVATAVAHVERLDAAFKNAAIAQQAVGAGRKKLGDTVPLRYLGQPENVAEMVVWPLSDRAKDVTGRRPHE
jgi:NAD(P)-dependent dehydrogenase (short-subunit alcohol dehydrogenase family)